ncbi:MAG TPA: cation:proton antiporter [Acidobacteriota bacterium]|nr:cation:proton antiporter [Acidobacteriota bacterium]
MYFADLFHEIAVILIVAAVIGAAAVKLKQPLIVGFILSGILIGPSGLNLVSEHRQLELLAEIGIAVLLFVVGLKLDLHLIKTTGRVALATGMGQIVFTSVIGFLIALALGISILNSIYIAVALTFSSTIIIVKLLSDKKEIDSLHGRIAVGFLIVQDIVVVLVMIALSAFGAGTGEESTLVTTMLLVALKGIAFIGVIALFMKYILNRLFAHLARSQELMVTFAIAWAILLAATGDLLGFSKEVGAFLAGVAIASTPYRESIGTRLVSLRDFLLLFFFINLGAHLDLSLLGTQLWQSLLFSAFVLVGNPLIVIIIMGIMGYRRRTGFLAGLTVAQISEFSFILAAMGLSLGHISTETVGLITLVGLITIGLSTYMILYSYPLYEKLSPFLRIFERHVAHPEDTRPSSQEMKDVDVILIGLGRYGRNIARDLYRLEKKVVCVDFDPEVLAKWRMKARPCIYADAGDPEAYDYLPLGSASMVINTIAGYDLNMNLLKTLKERSYSGRIILTAHNYKQAQSYYQAGADRVLRPFVDAAETAVSILLTSRDELHHHLPWPVAVTEIRLKQGSSACWKTISRVDLRARTEASIIAIKRSGRTFLNPEPDFVLYPGDCLLLSGEEESIATAEKLLREKAEETDHDVKPAFKIEEISAGEKPHWTGKSIGSLNLRQEEGISIISISRNDGYIIAPGPEEIIQPGDIFLVIRGNRQPTGKYDCFTDPR